MNIDIHVLTVYSFVRGGGFLSRLFSWGQSSNDPVIGTAKITPRKKSKEEKKVLRDKSKQIVKEEIIRYVSEIENLKKLLNDAHESRAASLSLEQAQLLPDIDKARSISDASNSGKKFNYQH